MKDKYRFIGPAYDFISKLYAGDSILKSKLAMVNPQQIQGGEKLLFAGVGHGKDAVKAAELGADVTVVDISETMLSRFRKELGQNHAALNIRIIHSDILEIDHVGKYDMVFANFFLNVFYEQQMKTILTHLVLLCRKGGKIVIGDFAYPSGNAFTKLLKNLYWYIAAFFFWVFTSNAIHKIYDYPTLLGNLGCEVKERKCFKLMGLNTYWSILAEKSH